ncbi:LPD29 domain-containing protein [Sulfurospirillum multivorans]|uniref:Large polyvalent protein associated domain-containing protein n=2 Tax=Sulfurospirillum multivorans TaxID=66821 RepID=A0AA86DYE1_SULMK|nr:LPD29 domain-containing protein [Sulfurospirillum multivorans]AHJ11310.1 hypothetical protein SMUL_0022 [Sulfurospirillum multivorans DSM 12446]QEH04815.1 hypothetical protein SMN_0021 [Sulfurospirillum multivorans]
MSVTAEATRAIKKELKVLYPELKFSVSMRDYSVVNVILKEGDIDFKQYKTKEGEIYYTDDKRDYFNVNDCHIDSHWKGLARKIFKDILQIIYKHCGRHYDRNAGDMGADYAGWNYFIRVSVGSWCEPYVKKG